MKWGALVASEARSESAVYLVQEGKRASCLDEAQTRDFLEGLFDHMIVFFVFKTAGAVDEGASWLQEGCGATQQGELLGGHPQEILVREAPAYIYPATENASIAAGGID